MSWKFRSPSLSVSLTGNGVVAVASSSPSSLLSVKPSIIPLPSASTPPASTVSVIPSLSESRSSESTRPSPSVSPAPSTESGMPSLSSSRSSASGIPSASASPRIVTLNELSASVVSADGENPSLSVVTARTATGNAPASGEV